MTNLFTDLWQLPNERLTSTLSDKIERNFYSRCMPDKRPYFLRYDDAATPVDSSEALEGDTEKASPRLSETNEDLVVQDEKVDSKEGMASVSTSTPINSQSKTRTKKTKSPKHDESLLMALHTTFFLRWWAAGVFKLCSGTDFGQRLDRLAHPKMC